VCESTRAALTGLDQVLTDAVETTDEDLNEMALHLIRCGGKRVRPALVLLLGSLGRTPADELLRTAAAVELLHVASLYHDDVMDQALTRRGAPSANGLWGNARAALAGTYVFACATRLLAGAGMIVNTLGGRAIADVCAGQLRELESSYDADLPVEEHLAVLERKTAALFVLPCLLGATLAALPTNQLVAVERFGRTLGLAFQLTDDALDLTGEAALLGKATGADIAEGVYSLPVLSTLRAGDAAARRLRALLQRAWLTAAEVDEALAIVRSGSAVDDALGVARRLAGEAGEAAGSLPEGPVRTSMRRLSDGLVERMS
jgi:heptaprenyl diphosphate synthase